MLVAGWDVGGAHVKIAVCSDGDLVYVGQVPCALWKGTHELDQAIDWCVRQLPVDTSTHAITMTGELCDLFADRAVGVQSIADQLRAGLNGSDLWFFAGDSGYVSIDDVPLRYASIGSANWLATASFVAKQVPNALLIDVGSTTTDMVLLKGGKAQFNGLTDGERLRNEELIYTGVVRTPVMGVAARAPFGGQWQGLANEHFATMADVYRLTGELADYWDQHESADGRGKSVVQSAVRLARMLGRDSVEADAAFWRQLAAYLRECQITALSTALLRHMSRPEARGLDTLVGAGCGRFLVNALAVRFALRYRDFAELIPSGNVSAEAIAGCAPAVASAYLLAESSR
jgi:probable H4MPT-linked C1 transfer pathway protein